MRSRGSTDPPLPAAEAEPVRAAANPLVTHWKSWLVLQKGVVLLALAVAYGVTWLVPVAAPFVVVGGASFVHGWVRDARGSAPGRHATAAGATQQALRSR